MGNANNGWEPKVEHVGELVRQERGRAGLTQEELAHKAEVSPTTVVRLESGEIRRPRISTLMDIADALGVPTEVLTHFSPALYPRTATAVQQPIDLGGVGPFTAVYQRDGEWWIGFVEELPGANAQGGTLKEARESLREAVELVLEDNRELTRREFEGGDVVREPLTV